MTQYAPGVYPDMTTDEYRSAFAWNQSFLWTAYSKTPYHARYEERGETTATEEGTATHAAILEPEHFEARFVRGPKDRRGNKWTGAKDEAEAAGCTLLTEGVYDKTLRIRDAILAHEVAGRVMTTQPSQAEVPFFWNDPDTGLLCKGLADKYINDPALLVDIKTKTAGQAAPRQFAKAAADYGMHVQAAFYLDGWCHATGEAPAGFLILAVERDAPFAIAPYELPETAVEEGRMIYKKALRTVAYCLEVGEWPGYEPGVQMLDLPYWAYRETN